MKRILPHIWNVLVLLFIIFVAMLVIPKARGQFTAPRTASDTIAFGYVAIGALIGLWLCAVSVISFFWFRVPIWFRIFIVLIIGVLVLGYFRVAALYASSPRAFGAPVLQSDLYTFFGTLIVFTFPLVITGYGYPGLIQYFWRRLSAKRNA